MVQWTKGWPGRAAETIELVLQETLRTGHKMEMISVLVMSACPIALLSKNYNDAHRYLALLDQVLDESGLEVWRPVALHYRGALMCGEENTLMEGTGMLEASIDRLERSGQKLRRAFFLGTLANALARVGRLAEATPTIIAALDHSAKSNERWCLPELLRIRAIVFLAENRMQDAEEYLTRAMASAHDLGMLSWQLRASNDLATMLHAQGRASEARAVLARSV